MPVVSPTYANLLIDEIKSLPESYVAEVLNFVGYLKTKAADEEDCPICAKHRDPVTGEPRFNAETIAAIEEGDAMLRGDIPATWHKTYDELDKVLGLK